MINVSSDRLERFLLIVLLANLAIAQPLFDLLGRQAEFLVAHAMGSAGLVSLAFALSMLLPVLLALLPLLAKKISSFAGELIFYLLFGLLAALVLMPALISAGWQGLAAIFAGVFVSLVVLMLYRAAAPLRLFFKYLTPAVLVFPLSFLFFSRAAPLLMADTADFAGGPANFQSRPDIVFVVLDEFPLVSLLTPELEIDRQRFPNFARLADQSDWYLAATTGSVVTVDAIPEALTGIETDPDANLLPIAAHYPRNLFTLLQDSYEITALETATRLCPRQLCTDRNVGQEQHTGLLDDLLLVYAHIVTPAPWVHSLPSVSNGWSGFNSASLATFELDPDLEKAIAIADLSGQMEWNSRRGQFRELVNRIRPGERPGLYYLHSLLPHRVWRYLPDGRQYLLEEVWAALDPPHSRPTVAGGQIFGHRWQQDKLAVDMPLQRHILQVMFVDLLIGELLDQLQKMNMLRDSLIVVMGDHGARFVPGQPRRMITAESLSDISAVPLFIKLPGQEAGRKIEKPAALIDILPTISDALGSAVDWLFSGDSLLDENRLHREIVSVKNSAGAVFSYPAAQHMAHLASRAAEHDALLGRGTSPEFYQIGPNPELLGTNPADYISGNSNSGRVVLDAPMLLRAVNLESDYVPLHLTGRLEYAGQDSGPGNLAVAVNGVIRAVSRTYDVDGFRNQFAAFLPPDALRDGENQVQVFLVDELNGRKLLSEMQQQKPWTFELIVRDGQEVLVNQLGQEWAVNKVTNAGRALTVEDEGAALVKLNGSLGTGMAPDSSIVAFRSGKYSGSSKSLDSYFRLPLLSGVQESNQQSSLRVFALADDEATELNYPAPCADHWHFTPPPAWEGIDCSPEAVNPLQLEDGVYRASLDFGQFSIRPYMGRGWDFNEGNISWGTGQQADLNFPIQKDLNGIKFEAMVQPFLAPPNLSQQEVFLLANDEKIASWIFEKSVFSPISWEISSDILVRGNGALKLSFLMPNAASPKSLDAGEDLRILGLAFSRMDIEAEISGQNK